jgi:hypothetical protein
MGRYGDVDYAWWAKYGFVASVAILTMGGGAELAAAALHLSLPAWEHALFVDMEILGTLGMLLCPLVFGIIMPLTE